jgi:AcrR family transcriptional regulator
MARTIPNIHSEIRTSGRDSSTRRVRGRPRTRSDGDVFAATRQVVAERGIARLTLADVARAAGLAPSTLAERYGSKRALLLAAVQDAPDDAAETFAAARAAHSSPLAALHSALAALASSVATREAFANQLGILALDVADADFRQVAERWFERTHDRLRSLLADALAAGELRPDADAAQLARAVLVAYNGALIVWSVTGTGPLAGSLRDDIDAVLSPWR